MGTGDRKIEQKEANKRQRAAASRRGRREQSGTMTLDAGKWLYLAALTHATMEQGGAVRIGKTRDGGALAVGMYCGDDYATEYIKPNEDFQDAIMEIAEAWLSDGAYSMELALRVFQQRLE